MTSDSRVRENGERLQQECLSHAKGLQRFGAGGYTREEALLQGILGLLAGNNAYLSEILHEITEIKAKLEPDQ